MAIFGQYTGARVSSLPSGFLGAAMQSAAQTQKGLSDIGETLGKAIEGYGRQKREDMERTQLAESLYGQVRGDDVESYEIPEELIAKRQAMSDQGNMVAKDRFTTEKKAGVDESFKREKMNLFLAKRQNQQDLSASQKQLDELHNKLNDYNSKLTQSPENLDKYGVEIGKASIAIKKLESNIQLYDNLIKQADTEFKLLEKSHQEALGQIGSGFKPDTSFIDEVYGNPAEYAQQKTVPGEVEEEAARRLGPKLIRKMEQGEMTKADELLLIDTLQSMKKEQAAARTPQGRLAEAQLGAYNDNLKKQKALAGAIQAVGNLPGDRPGRTQTGLTPENSASVLIPKVQSGQMLAADAIAADDAMVDSLKSYAPPQSGVPALPGVGQRTLQDWQNLGDTAVGNDPTFSDRQRPAGQEVPANPGHDYYNPEGYKSNRAFQRDYGQTYSDENQRRMWQIERTKYTTNAPEGAPALPQATPAQADPAPAAGAQPFMVDLPSRVDLTAEEKRQQALDFVNSQAGELGVAGLAAARAEVDRRFPQPLPNGLRPNQVTVGPDGRQSTVYTPRPEEENYRLGELIPATMTINGKQVPVGGFLYDPRSGKFIEPSTGGKIGWNELQSKIGVYRGQMALAEEQVQEAIKLDANPAGFWRLAEKIAPAYLQSAEWRQYESAAAVWVQGKLRFDSGAAVPISEAKQYVKDWFPTPGDDDQTVKNKERLRKQAIQTMDAILGPERIAATGGGTQPGQAAGAATTMRQFDSTGNEVK